MPMKPKKPCRYPNCPNLTDGSYCESHKHLMDKKRMSPAERGYDSRWRKARKVFLSEHPLCVECLKNNIITAAVVVDHITPHRGNKKLFWDESNWQSLCKSCHDNKTMTEDRYQEYKY